MRRGVEQGRARLPAVFEVPEDGVPRDVARNHGPAVTRAERDATDPFGVAESVEMQRRTRRQAGLAVPGADVAIFTHRDQGSAVRAERKIEDRRAVLGGPERVHELPRPIGQVDSRGAVEVTQADAIGQFHASGQPEEAVADLGPVAKAQPSVECQLGLALDSLDAMALRGRVGGSLGDSFVVRPGATARRSGRSSRR